MQDDAEHPIYGPLRVLVDRWCERRDLGALATLLPAYLSNNGLTDGWAELLEALRRLRHSYPLPDDELDVIHRLVVDVEGMVYR